MLYNIFFCLIGFLFLYYGAEWLVKASSSLARSLGVSPVVIGLTIVAFGTSAPELVVSFISSIQGKSMIAVGNVIGSNICNISLIMGVCALFQPLTCHASVIKQDIPMMLGVSVYLLLLSFNSVIGRCEGITLIAGILVYTLVNYYLTIHQNNSEMSILTSEAVKELEDIGYIANRYQQVLFILIGVAGVVAGAQLVVEAAVKIMKVLGVSEKFIGLTIVAFGTSLPELATSVVAAIRKEMDISIGNLVGSNIFNILMVIGAAAAARPIVIPGGFWQSGLYIDYMVMMLTSFLPWLLMRKNCTITRSGGGLLVSCYICYLIYLIWKA